MNDTAMTSISPNSVISTIRKWFSLEVVDSVDDAFDFASNILNVDPNALEQLCASDFSNTHKELKTTPSTWNGLSKFLI